MTPGRKNRLGKGRFHDFQTVETDMRESFDINIAKDLTEDERMILDSETLQGTSSFNASTIRTTCRSCAYLRITRLQRFSWFLPFKDIWRAVHEPMSATLQETT